VTRAPNLLLILAENHRASMTGCYGNPYVKTPNIDRFAAEGVRFGNAYCTSPICCPSRASIATGRYPHETGYWENSTAYDGRVPTWMHRVRASGHRVAATGKLHFRSTEDDNGFSEEIEPMHIADGVGGLVGLLRASGDEPVRPGNWDMYAKNQGAGTTTYQEYDRRITGHAIEWLSRQAARDRDRPWALSVHYGSAHPPFVAPQRLLDLYPVDEMPLPDNWRADERPQHPAIRHLRHILGTPDTVEEVVLRRMAAGHAAVITHLDKQVGEVVACLEALGLKDNTRIIYTSDHGDCAGDHYIFGKFCMYEQAIAVPFLMSGPDVPAGGQVDQFVQHVDLFPTILESFGVEAHDEDRGMRGMSLWPAIGGCAVDRGNFLEYHALGSTGASYVFRRGKDKLVYHVGLPNQLFDLEADPGETTDLLEAGRGADVAAGLEDALRQILDPEEADARAKADQLRMVELRGGTRAILERGSFPYTPAPGEKMRFEKETG
jgi:choline-sulfatase